jgi:hypothetical protein
MLRIAAELVRHIRGYIHVSKEDIAISIPAGKLELACIIDLLVFMCHESFFTKFMKARLLEMRDCVFAHDIWNQEQERFYELLGTQRELFKNCK